MYKHITLRVAQRQAPFYQTRPAILLKKGADMRHA